MQLIQFDTEQSTQVFEREVNSYPFRQVAHTPKEIQFRQFGTVQAPKHRLPIALG